LRTSHRPSCDALVCKNSEIGIIAACSFLCASKFDEIDYALPSVNTIQKEMNRSKYFGAYERDFVQSNFISCEKEICKRLEWNFHQMTIFHFFENLVSQGIFDDCPNTQLKNKTSWNREIYKSVNGSDNYGTTESRGSRAYSMSKNDQWGNRTENKTYFREASNYNASNRAGANIKRIIPGEGANLKNQNKDNKRSESSVKTSRNTFSSTLNEPNISNIKQISEYLIKLSLLVFKAQNYPSSCVAVSWILAARHISRTNPLWPENIAIITGYSLSKIIKIANLILSNYNMLEIGSLSIRTSQSIGIQPHAFDGELIKDFEPNDSTIENLLESLYIPPEMHKKWDGDKNSNKLSFKELKKSYQDHNAIFSTVDKNLKKLYSTNTSNSSIKKQIKRNNTNSDGLRNAKVQILGSSSSNLSIIQKASTTFKKGINGFLHNTGNILKQVTKDISQEDFSFVNAFKKYDLIINQFRYHNTETHNSPASKNNQLQRSGSKHHNSYIPTNIFENGKSSQISEKQTVESTSNSNTWTESEKTKIPRQNSSTAGYVAPLNYRRRSKSPKFDELRFRNEGIIKISKAKESIQTHNDVIVVRERRTTQELPSKHRVEKAYSIENDDNLPIYHRSNIPENNMRQSLRNLDGAWNLKVKPEMTLSQLESNIKQENLIISPFAWISNRNQPKRFNKEVIHCGDNVIW
jgi:hypothetical protein